MEITPDYFVNGIGYLSDMEYLGEQIKGDFVDAVVHKSDPTVFLGGFARPVIGNIPTICELQARLISDIIMEKCERPSEVDGAKDRASQERKYPTINTDATQRICIPIVRPLTASSYQPLPIEEDAPDAFFDPAVFSNQREYSID